MDTAAAVQKLEAVETQLKDLRRVRAQLRSDLRDAQVMYDSATEQLADYNQKLEKLTALLQAEQAAHHTELKEASCDPGGRPRGHAGREKLEQKWSSMSAGARRAALCRHTSEIKNKLMGRGRGGL
eukprot:726544-Pleurochrysis_carterae.AAC.1